MEAEHRLHSAVMEPHDEQLTAIYELLRRLDPTLVEAVHEVDRELVRAESPRLTNSTAPPA